MKIVNTALPKVCFSRPGDVIQLPADDTGDPDGPLYMVCTIPNSVATWIKIKARKREAQPSNGLYSEERPLWLINLETGEGEPMPHLSSRCRIVRDATLTYDLPPP